MALNSIDSPLVSVLMTSYNNDLYVGKAIDSIISQTYQNWELLIADDNSSDQTKSIIDSYSDNRIRRFHNIENMHYLRTRNKLVKYVRGKYITLLDADDQCSSDRLRKQLNAFENDHELALCGTLVSYIDYKGKPLKIKDEKPLSYEDIKVLIKTKNVFTGSTIMVKTSVWNEIGGYRDYFSTFGYEDYDFTSRIVEKYKAINLPLTLYQYRQYSESFSKKRLINNPFKLHGYMLVQQFIEQRHKNGSDKLMDNDIPWIINYILKINEPYVQDNSLIYRNLAWSNYNRNNKGIALKLSIFAISKRPFVFANIKLLVNLILITLKFKNT